MKALGHETHFPEGWYETFRWESRPDSVPADRWPRLDMVVSQLVDEHRRLRQAIAQAPDDLLATPVAGNAGRTVRYSVVHGLHDEACHTGEILLLWKMQGLGRPPRGSG